MSETGRDDKIMSESTYDEAVEALRTVYSGRDANPDLADITSHRDEVIERYQSIFSLDHLPSLTEAEVQSFLRFENNHHWSSIHRSGARICEDMDNLREALSVLLDRSRPLAQRYNEAVGKIKGLGKATTTPILLVAYPDEYGVWNSISEEGIKRVNLWPDFERGSTAGDKYAQINEILNQLADDLDVDLWTLDALWWGLEPEEEGLTKDAAGQTFMDEDQRFALERHLHDFLRDNWDRTTLGREWELYSEPGDEDAGYEYPTGIGRIDLLAQHRQKREWLVVELKREQGSDETVGQVLRYIGWVRRELADPDEVVRGLVIARQPSKSLLYALDALTGMDIVDVKRYEVEFNLFPTSLELD